MRVAMDAPAVASEKVERVGATILAPAELANLRDEWRALVAAAIESNPFLEPWFLEPAIAALAEESAPVNVLALRSADALVGLIPFIPLKRYRGLPVRALQGFRHIYDALGTPLLHRDHARAALSGFLDWLADRPEMLFELTDVSADGPFRWALVDVLRERKLPLFTIESHTRAVLEPRANAEHYIEQVLPGKKRKEFRRLERRLAELGAIEYTTAESPDDARVFGEQFLAIEASGWKGERGTAFAMNPEHARFFETIVGGAAEAARFQGLRLTVAGRPVALFCTLKSPADARGRCGYFAWKVAYDEEFAKHSPGVLLELENIRRMHDEGPHVFMDSCASPDHFVSNRLWMDRRLIDTVVLPCGTRAASWLVSSMPLLQFTRRVTREWFS